MAGSVRDVKAVFRLQVDDKGFAKADAGIEKVKAQSAKATAAAEKNLAKASAAASATRKHGAEASKAIEGLQEHMSRIGAKFGLGPVAEGMEGLHGILGKVTQGLPGAGVGFAAVGAALVGLGEKTAKTAIEMSNSAMRVNMDVIAFQELLHGAEATGTGIETVNMTLGRLGRSMYDAGQGNAEALKSFRALGIEVKGADGKLRPTQQVLYDLADKMAAMPEGAERGALAMKVLGRSGLEAVPWLSRGSAALKGFAKGAHEAGVIVSKDTIKMARAYGLAKHEIAETFEGLELQLGAKVLPYMVDIAKGFEHWLVSIRPFLASGLDHYLTEAVSAFQIIGTVLEPVIVALKSIPEVMQKIGSLGGGRFAQAFDGMLNPIKSAYGYVDEIRRILSGEASQMGYLKALRAGKGEEYLKHAEAGGKFKSLTGDILRDPTRYKRGMDVGKFTGQRWEESDWMGKAGIALAGAAPSGRTNMQQGEIDKRLESFRKSYGRAPTEQEYKGIEGDADYAYRKQLAEATAGGMRGGAATGGMVPGLPMPGTPWSPELPASFGGKTTTTNVSAPMNITVTATQVDADSLMTIVKDAAATTMREAAMSLPD